MATHTLPPAMTGAFSVPQPARAGLAFAMLLVALVPCARGAVAGGPPR